MEDKEVAQTWLNAAKREGRLLALTASVVGLYEDRFGATPADLQAAVEATEDEHALRAWIGLAATESAEDFANTVRVHKSRNDAIVEVMSRVVVRIYEARFGEMPVKLRALVEETRDERVLEDWIVLAGTGSEMDVALGIYVSRAAV